VSEISVIRDRIRFQGPAHAEIGCVLIVQPTFFNEADWIVQPSDWPARTVSDKGYDLTTGEGARIWAECLARSRPLQQASAVTPAVLAGPLAPRYGAPTVIHPRLGQARFALQSWMHTAAHVPLLESIACPRLRQLTSGPIQAKGHTRCAMASSCGQTSTGSLTKVT
jgi:hypothetical protein